MIQSAAHNRGWDTHFPLTKAYRQIGGLLNEPSFELTSVLQDMKTATLVIADLSLERPSCYYELGLAQSLGVPTLVLAASGTRIHQLADRENVLFYVDLKQLETLVAAALDKHSLLF